MRVVAKKKKFFNGLLLSIAVLGVLICLASVFLFGADITAYINNGFILHGKFRLTTILSLMHVWTPDLWTPIINLINDGPESFNKTLIEFAVSLPASLIGGLIGMGLVMIGFRVETYYKD